ncbi:hypothetical protein, partial [Cronobacter sakazakii]
SQGVVGRWASNDITDAEFTEVKDTAPRSKSADKGTDAVLALGSAGVISGFSADDDNGSGAINTEYDSRYSYTPPTADGSSVINHGTEQGGQPA